MTPLLKEVRPLSDFQVLLIYQNEDQKIFDVKPYLHLGAFAQLKNEELFSTVKISFDTIEWANGLDIDPDDLFHLSKFP